MDEHSAAASRALELLSRAPTVFRMSEALGLGVSRYALYSLVEAGLVERLARGLYQLASLPPVSYPDQVVVARRIPNGVLCLISALCFHNLTTQIPHVVWVAIPPRLRYPRVDWPPIRAVRFGGEIHTAGVETHVLDGVAVKVYCAEKTIADCFRYRNKVGLDIALEALREYWRERRQPDVAALIHYARICKVDRVMRPYLEILAL